ncbi:hypothetical protein FSP39_008747 [Pinctada imbricata]|uniref:Uncharacterized protein n=1 Tax=Pinctada imbricata TaxID=66713 RepID=A0AA88XQW4_PINIB|nr:hypothetical protein FSP39_008747 [Pinctada imbricata]
MFLSVIHGFNFIHDFYMQDTTGGSCNENINVENNLFLRSHIGSFQLGNLIKYGDNQDCTLTLDAGTGKFFSIIIAYV